MSEGKKSPANYSPYQQKIIKRYYDNQDTLQRQRLAARYDSAQRIGERGCSSNRLGDVADPFHDVAHRLDVADDIIQRNVRLLRRDHQVESPKLEIRQIEIGHNASSAQVRRNVGKFRIH